jgi:hypothetical protein
MSTDASNDMAAFQELLSSSKHIIAVAGAGLSAASGKFSSNQVEMSADISLRYPNFPRIGRLVAEIRRDESSDVQRVQVESVARMAVLPLQARKVSQPTIAIYATDTRNALISLLPPTLSFSPPERSP